MPAPRPADRRTLGQYYTPPELVETLLARALDPLLAERRGTEPFRVCDPACGDGAFLLPAAERLATRVAAARGAAAPADDDWQTISPCLVGRDVDAAAIAGFRRRWRERTAAPPPADVGQGDALELLAGPPCDATVGNPPFANAIEGRFSAAAKAAWSAAFPELRGTADRAYYFAALADRLTKPDGAVGLVLPRSFLAAPSARALRLRLERERPPAFLAAPDDPHLFPAANVFVALVVLRRGAAPAAAGGNWWAALSGGPTPPADGPTLGTEFEIFQSMTAEMAYAAANYVHEAEALPGDAPRLVTTGLIDPDRCHWGERPCRYLGRDFLRPALDAAALPPPLAARIAKTRRPKLLVAGLSDRLEAWFDETGAAAGAVATLTVLHPRDDLAALRRAAAALHRPAATQRLHAELGALALGGRRVTIPKSFVAALPTEP